MIKRTTTLLNTGFMTGSNLFAKVAAYLYFWIIVKKFSSEEIGIYAILITSYLLMELLANLGLDKIVIRELSIRKTEKANATFFFSGLLKLCLSLITFVVFLMLFALFYPALLKDNTWGILFILIAVFPTAVSRNIEDHFTAIERMHFPAISQVVERLVLLIAAVMAFFEFIGFQGFLGGFFAASMARMLMLAAVYPWKALRQRSPYSWNQKKALLHESIQILLVEALALIYFRVDIFMLSKMLDLNATGIYQVAYKIFDFFISLFAGFLIAIFPTFSREGKEFPVKQHLWKGAVLMTGISLPVIFFRRPILMFFDAEYVAAETVMIYLMLTLPLVYMNSILANFMVVLKRIDVLVYLALILAPLNICLNFLLIPMWGVDGAAVATLMCEIMGSIVFMLEFRKISMPVGSESI
jgi:O-antigen/teichoic acid export membrane protein